MEYREYEKVRDEAEKYAKKILKETPKNFTLLHLEYLKNVVPEQIDNTLFEIKSKTTLDLLPTL